MATACDPTTLAAAAKCLNCLNADEQEAVYTNLLCARANAAVTPPNLLNGLFAYWNLNEASGVRADSLGLRSLVDNVGVGSAAAKIGNGLQGVPPTGNVQYNGLQTDFEFVGTPFTFCAWVKLAAKATDYSIVGPWRASISRSWRFYYNFTLDHYVFDIITLGAVVAAPSPVIGTFDFAVWWNDGINSSIQINNGAIVSAAVLTPLAGAATFKIASDHSDTNPFDGIVDEVGVWNRILTAAERTLLYNGGAGKTYPFP